MDPQLALTPELQTHLQQMQVLAQLQQQATAAAVAQPQQPPAAGDAAAAQPPQQPGQPASVAPAAGMQPQPATQQQAQPMDTGEFAAVRMLCIDMLCTDTALLLFSQWQLLAMPFADVQGAYRPCFLRAQLGSVIFTKIFLLNTRNCFSHN